MIELAGVLGGILLVVLYFNFFLVYKFKSW